MYHTFNSGRGDRGAGARENRGREGYKRREKKGLEAREKFKKACFRYLLLLIIQSKKCVFRFLGCSSSFALIKCAALRWTNRRIIDGAIRNN